jgi:SAM-dependent methyltransferase
MMFRVLHPNNLSPPAAQARILAPARRHYRLSDEPLFTAAYNELCRIDLNGKRVLEVCCGEGMLAACLASAFPSAEIIGIDRYQDNGMRIKEAMDRLPRLSYLCGDALCLSRYSDASFDLIYGQAALHHLAHDTEKVAAEYSRLLKSGGRLMFIFEPLGHNLLVAAIRAMRLARMEAEDESNLYLSMLKSVGAPFASCEVQVFNLLAYPLKVAQSVSLAKLIQRIDLFLLQHNPKLLPFCANCNVIYTK